MSWIKKIAAGLTYLAFLFISVAVLLEIIFNVLPTSTPVNLQSVTSEQDILRFKANQTTNFSLGANFYKTVTKKTNNDGFYSSFDYEKGKPPKIMIIGDSYVEAMQIDNSDTVGEVLKTMDKMQDIYQMGVSGVPLSQYIKMAEYAKNNYAPKQFVILIVGNDFDQSLCDYRIKLGTWCFDEDFELTFIPFGGYEGIRKYAKKSAFIRYLVFHVGMDWRRFISRLGLKSQGMYASSQYAGNVEIVKDQEILNKSLILVNRFFEELKNLQIINRVTLVLDANRQDIYNNQITESYFQKMREATISRAKAHNVNIIDMQPIFENDYKANGVKFEFPTDGHWNEHAHKLLAEALKKNLPI